MKEERDAECNSDGEGGEDVIQNVLRTSFDKLATNVDDFYIGGDMRRTIGKGNDATILLLSRVCETFSVK